MSLPKGLAFEAWKIRNRTFEWPLGSFHFTPEVALLLVRYRDPNSLCSRQEALPMASIILPAGHSDYSESRPGRFGVYGGRYVPETLMAGLVELKREYGLAKADAAFQVV